MIRKVINDALRELNIDEQAFAYVPEPKSKIILDKIESNFVTPNRSKRWWWENFTREEVFSARHLKGQGFRWLDKVAPDENSVWFVAEARGKSPEDFILYETHVKYIIDVIGECFPFEYYVVSKNHEWLVCENHHDFLIAVGEKAVKRLKRVVETSPNEWWTLVTPLTCRKPPFSAT